jgi:anti-sigma regulatory factor (Ser/Thr protein kinase)
MVAPSSADLTLRCDLDEVARADAWLQEFCAGHGVVEDALYDLRLCLDEVLANVIRHGYGIGETGTILVTIECPGDRVRLEVRDAAAPFNPLDAADPDLDVAPEDRPIGGLGIFLVRQLMDTVSYDYEHGENRLSMERSLGRR